MCWPSSRVTRRRWRATTGRSPSTAATSMRSTPAAACSSSSVASRGRSQISRSALALAPDHAGALDQLVDSLLAHRRGPASRARALAAVTRALAAKETSAAKALFVQCVRNRKFTSDALGVRPLVLRALSEPWDRPADLAVPAVSLVKLNPAVTDCCARAAARVADAAHARGFVRPPCRDRRR